MVTVLVLLGTWLMLALAGETRTGRVLRRLLVAKPAARLSRWTRGQVIVLAGAVMFAVLLLAVFGHEALEATAFGMPEAVAPLASMEFSVYIDALVTVTLSASLARAKGAMHWLRARVATRHPRAQRAPRQRRVRTPRKPPSNDDEPAGLPLAA